MKKNAYRFINFESIYLLLVTLAAVWVRVWFVQVVPTEQVFDFATYHEIATNIANSLGHSFRGAPVAWQGPAYPLFLGLIYRLAGDCSELAGKYVNVILSVLTLLMFYLLLRRFSKNVVFVCGAYTMAAFLPNFLAYNNVIGTEVFFTFIFMLILLLQVYPFQRQLLHHGRYRRRLSLRWLRVPALGILIGAAALTKPFFLAYPFVAALYYWFKEKDLKKTAVFLGIVYLMTAVVITPWAYRNYTKFGEFIPISYNGGYVLYINNNDLNVSGGWMDPLDIPAPERLQEEKKEILEKYDGHVQLAYELDPLLRKEALRWIAAHPLDFLELGIIRLKTTFFMGAWDIRSWGMNGLPSTQDLKEEPGYRRALSFFHALSDVLIYLLSSMGLWYMFVGLIAAGKAVWRKERGRLPDGALITVINLAFLVLVIFVFEGQARYNFPALFLLITGLFSFAGGNFFTKETSD